ncbi:hypothetical protein JTB14_011086 [Gonioctena quinquepunctata]|nr:hypothetical protein JTB14_011086 [Gonioctena quinquepunctata]
MGLRPPPKDKKNLQTIHIEFDLPLLEEPHLERSETKILTQKPDQANKKIQTVKGKGKSPRNTSSEGGTRKSSLKSKDTKRSSPYEKPNEYDVQLEENNFSFETARLPWNAIMEFPPVFIESPENDVTAIRDTFRSNVEIRVVYVKFSLNSKEKMKKKKKKSAKDKKKKGKKKSDKKSTQPKIEDIAPADIEETPKKTIIKKVTLYSFNCHLETINWSDESIDYYWTDHPKMGKNALRMDGCLKDLQYTKNAKEKNKGKNKTDQQTNQDLVYQIPKRFTCHFGFGLKRI